MKFYLCFSFFSLIHLLGICGLAISYFDPDTPKPADIDVDQDFSWCNKAYHLLKVVRCQLLLHVFDHRDDVEYFWWCNTHYIKESKTQLKGDCHRPWKNVLLVKFTDYWACWSTWESPQTKKLLESSVSDYGNSN